MSSARGEQVAELLLGIGAVALRPRPPFRYRSGMRSPIYTDNRLLCSYPEQRGRIAEHFAHLLAEQGLAPDLLAGVATAGIPHAAWLAARLDLPMVYVRDAAKAHGTGRRIEGTLWPRADPAVPAPDEGPPARPAPEVVVVEDTVTTGGGALEAVAGVRAEGGRVQYCLAICTYGFPRAAAAFSAAGVTLLPLCTFDDLVAAAGRLGRLGAGERELLLDWRTDPEGWAARHGLDADG